MAEIHETAHVSEEDSGVVVDVIHQCSSCGGEHTNVFFSRFTQPMTINRRKYWYWGMCPTLHEPIIMARKDEQHGK